MEVAMTKKSMEVFCCYARKDQSLLKKLIVHLMPLQRQGLISVWNDMNISPGAVWEAEVSKHLNTAQVVLLLISPDFMASEYCYDIEMQRALERHDVGEARVIPILLRPVDWLHTPFGKLQALPPNAKPATTWSDRDQAFLEIALGVRQTIEELLLRGNPSIPGLEQGNTPKGSINSGTTPTSTPLHSPSSPPTPSTDRSILGFLPLTDSKTIQQRVKLVAEVYTKLTQPDVTAVVLTGIGGVGKSTLAALVYRYAEEQQRLTEDHLQLNLFGLQSTKLSRLPTW